MTQGACTLSPRLGDRGVELESPEFEALGADEDAGKAARRPGVVLCVFTAAVEEEVIGAAWCDGMAPRGPLEDVLEQETGGLLLLVAERMGVGGVRRNVREGQHGAATVAPPELLFGERKGGRAGARLLPGRGCLCQGRW